MSGLESLVTMEKGRTFQTLLFSAKVISTSHFAWLTISTITSLTFLDDFET